MHNKLEILIECIYIVEFFQKFSAKYKIIYSDYSVSILFEGFLLSVLFNISESDLKFFFEYENNWEKNDENILNKKKLNTWHITKIFIYANLVILFIIAKFIHRRLKIIDNIN